MMRAFAWGGSAFLQLGQLTCIVQNPRHPWVVRSDEYAFDRRTFTSNRTPVRRLDPLPCLG